MTGAVKNEFDSRVTLLVYCTTCQILRPPRSFHCHTCNACIEVHDHHCPWVGTCVAKRNHRYFCLFLLTTSIHSLATFLISISSMLRVSGSIFYDPNGTDPQHTGKLVVLIYSGLFALSLLSFFLFQNSLVMKNLTSNEHLRRRWNARQDR
jgi:palmitoyltransferase ZDHHC9/14/18